ncbi:MAG TPA: TRAP transporter substrate-binding protein, partial [Arenibaculum sp.]|nr:TRAP transporter substrate-binding protein [Arenibaculum sp.]
KPPQLVDQVRDGFVDVVWTLPSYTPGRFPMMSVFELPFMVTTADATSRAAQEYYETYARDEFADIKPLMFHVHARGVIHAGDPVEKVSDLRGKTVRAPSRQVGEALEAFGASPVFMPASQLPEALSKGVIDATVLPWEVAGSLKVPELVDAHTEIEGERGLYTSVFMLAMNKGKYEGLPDDLKAVIDANSGMNLVERAGPVWDDAEEPGRQAAIERGNTIVTLDPAEVEKMRQASAGVAERWAEDLTAKGKDGRQLLEAAQALIEKHSAAGN